MSELTALASYGPPHRNSGLPRQVDLVGELLVGGSGLWRFHRLTGEPQDVVRLRSRAALAAEVQAGFALSGLLPEIDPAVDQLVGPGWREAEVDVPTGVVEELAALVRDVPVAVVLTNVGLGGTADELAAWQPTAWSVVVTTPTAQRVRTQWGDA